MVLERNVADSSIWIALRKELPFGKRNGVKIIKALTALGILSKK